MKLTLQLVVVVLNAQTNFRDNFLKFTLHTSQYDTRRHEIASQPPFLPFQHNLFHEIRTPTVNNHARIVEIG